MRDTLDQSPAVNSWDEIGSGRTPVVLKVGRAIDAAPHEVELFKAVEATPERH
jgi:hypothetical protein